jgi:hypothetical protein
VYIVHVRLFGVRTCMPHLESSTSTVVIMLLLAISPSFAICRYIQMVSGKELCLYDPQIREHEIVVHFDIKEAVKFSALS